MRAEEAMAGEDRGMRAEEAMAGEDRGMRAEEAMAGEDRGMRAEEAMAGEDRGMRAEEAMAGEDRGMRAEEHGKPAMRLLGPHAPISRPYLTENASKASSIPVMKWPRCPWSIHKQPWSQFYK